MTDIFHQSFSSSVKSETVFEKHHRGSEFPSYKSLCRESDLPLSANFFYPSFLFLSLKGTEELHGAYCQRLTSGEKLAMRFCLGTIPQGHPWDISGCGEKVEGAGQGSGLPLTF